MVLRRQQTQALRLRRRRPRLHANRRHYIHFIPWEKLEITTTEDLLCSGVNVDVLFTSHGPNTEWAKWLPPRQGFAWNHHIHIDDEVYDYNVTKNWLFPDHCVEDKVVFHVQELQRSELAQSIMDYWTFWVRSSNMIPAKRMEH